ncbi:hypothetical protein CDAR_419861 [Caerostris darwini]|uniref:Uncharacterized protein n=1 Tax=Caerostris darwini TaxID=1538125 RepID=A0AAV4UH04_9ARAC|nr:hypothetical protein CDAR_419861 [Caerostris darwini]
MLSLNFAVDGNHRKFSVPFGVLETGIGNLLTLYRCTPPPHNFIVWCERSKHALKYAEVSQFYSRFSFPLQSKSAVGANFKTGFMFSPVRRPDGCESKWMFFNSIVKANPASHR